MTDTTTLAQAGAQPSADANSIDSIIDAATIPEPDKGTTEEPKPQDAESDDDNKPWPKKASNALAHEKGRTAEWKAKAKQNQQVLQQLQAEVERLKNQSSPPTAQQGSELSVAKTGIPTKLKEGSFSSYADFIEARAEEIADYKIDKKFADYDGKQKETQQTEQQQRWVAGQEQVIAQSAQKFASENPEAAQVIADNADVLDEFPPQIQRVILEAGEMAPVAIFNLAKEGKLEALGEMSPARAAIEIGRAQTQAFTKPKTKAPTPLPASRGSVPSGKSLDDMSGAEMRSWLRSPSS